MTEYISQYINVTNINDHWYFVCLLSQTDSSRKWQDQEIISHKITDLTKIRTFETQSLRSGGGCLGFPRPNNLFMVIDEGNRPQRSKYSSKCDSESTHDNQEPCLCHVTLSSVFGHQRDQNYIGAPGDWSEPG